MKLHVQRLQDAFRRMVVNTGECWAPDEPGPYLTGHVEASVTGADPGTHLAELVAAVFCLANQYGVVLQHAFADAALNADLADAPVWAGETDVPRLRQAAATVVRTVEYYRSDAAPDSEPGIVGLHASLPELLLAACGGFDSADVLADRLVARMRAAVALPDRPFDPSCAEGVGLIRPVQEQTYCPFAQKSLLWGAPAYDRTLSLDENMAAAAPWVRRFVKVLDADVLDGFVFAFPTDVFGETLEDLGRLFRGFIDYLIRTMTAAAPAGLDPAVVTDPKWYLVLEGEECFVSVFAPCYPHDHSRYMYGIDGWALFMLQPEKAILRQLTVTDYHPRANAIRDRYRDAFQPYAPADLEIDRFLLPLRAGDPPLRWYEPLSTMD